MILSLDIRLVIVIVIIVKTSERDPLLGSPAHLYMELFLGLTLGHPNLPKCSWADPRTSEST